MALNTRETINTYRIMKFPLNIITPSTLHQNIFFLPIEEDQSLDDGRYH